MSAADIVEIYSSDDEKAPETIDLSTDNTSQDTCSEPKKRKNCSNKDVNQNAAKESTDVIHSAIQKTSNMKQSEKSKENDIIEIDRRGLAETPSILSLDEFINDFDKKDFTLEFLQLLEVCLKYDNSDGMQRIVCKNLIPRYCLLSDSYKSSLDFQRFMENSLSKLLQNPNKKFSCLKDVSEHFKTKIERKKVNLTTLDTAVSDKTKKLYAKESSNNGSNKEMLDNVGCVIDLDDIDDEDVVEVTDTITNDVDKENLLTHNHNPTFRNDRLLVTYKRKNSSHDDTNNNKDKYSECERPNILIEEISDREQMVKSIELEIRSLKQKLAVLEVTEVTTDNIASPYVNCDSIQRRIVQLYTKLVDLCGEESCLRPKIFLKIVVPAGQAAGPARAVQRWLNEPTDDGDQRFPNLRDVFKCVARANQEDCLGWSVEEQWRQATQLFTKTGQLLQRHRQQREWRDLVERLPALHDPTTLCDPGPLDPVTLRDPADDDPELRARLDANRALARTKEADILQRYAMLEQLPRRVKATKVVAAIEADPCTTEQPAPSIEIEVPSFTETILSLGTPGQQDPVTPSVADAATEDVKPVITPNYIDPNTEILCSDSDDYSTETAESDIEFDIPDNCLNLFTPMCIKEETAPLDCVKTEEHSMTSKDTLRTMLEFDQASLAQASVTTIFEEPTVFIEVSSSDDET